MTDAPMRAFVNEQPVELPRAATARDAVAALDPALAEQLDAGAAYLTDGRGIRLDPAAPLAPGAIIRAVVSARRESHADT